MSLYTNGQAVRNRFTGRIGTVVYDVGHPQIVCGDGRVSPEHASLHEGQPKGLALVACAAIRDARDEGAPRLPRPPRLHTDDLRRHHIRYTGYRMHTDTAPTHWGRQANGRSSGRSLPPFALLAHRVFDAHRVPGSRTLQAGCVRGTRI